MSRSPISAYQIFQLFPDQETARIFMEQKRWPDGPQCPHCQETERIGHKRPGYYCCNACMEWFTVPHQNNHGALTHPAPQVALWHVFDGHGT